MEVNGVMLVLVFKMEIIDAFEEWWYDNIANLAFSVMTFL